ncbi:hypothetical protein CLV90_2965 [Maribacter spongiicola]|uniref:Uncharacterized protein n=1 Tax=Maribacter spongiicola TaxID=1206753 RepID=A0A4R7JZ86_9FLAO|nr:hypothetical protein [Maribacter spongiicola]TDT43841.1 hypothetical protein CLV90_2965 [Maribacter spongiicola]
MKKPNTAIYIALAIVVVGLVFQFMEMGVFGEDPMPKVTQFNQLFFWTGIAVWALGYMQQEAVKKKDSENDL